MGHILIKLYVFVGYFMLLSIALKGKVIDKWWIEEGSGVELIEALSQYLTWMSDKDYENLSQDS